MFLNVSLAISLSFYVGFLAAAIGTSISSWVMIFLLWNGCKKMGDSSRIDARLKRNLPFIILSSILMGMVIYIVQYFLNNSLHTPNIRYLMLTILIFSGNNELFIFYKFIRDHTKTKLKDYDKKII